MFRNYLNVYLNYIWKYRLFTASNFVGIALAIFASLVLSAYIIHDKSFDRFNKNGSKIVLVYSHVKFGVDSITIPLSSFSTGPILMQNSPHVHSFARIYKPYKASTVENKHIPGALYSESELLFVDSNFMDFFCFDLIKGDKKRALVNPLAVVITQGFAKKYFGALDPIGKILSIDREANYVITGVSKDCPSNSSVQYQILVSSVSKQFPPGSPSLSEAGVNFGDWKTFLLLNNCIDPLKDCTKLTNQFST